MLVDPCSVSDRSKAWSACLWGITGGVRYEGATALLLSRAPPSMTDGASQSVLLLALHQVRLLSCPDDECLLGRFANCRHRPEVGVMRHVETPRGEGVRTLARWADAAAE